MDSLSEVVALSSLLTVSFHGGPNPPRSLYHSASKADQSQDICDSPPSCFNYIFTTFGGDNGKNERQLDVYASADGIHFSPYVMGAYQPENTLLRDPSIILHDDGWYYVCHTTSWVGDDFAVIRSKDLKGWDHVVTIKSSHAELKVAQSWAPVCILLQNLP
jgi:sucrose-6-phosphate hydrolase SacC (GH32 family)